MSRRNSAPPSRSRPIDRAALETLALSYVGRYATTRARLRAYLARKVAERDWAGDDEPPLNDIVARCAELGYVDDAGFAAARGAALTRRGYGEQRVAAALRAVGIDAETAAPVRQVARESAEEAALAFARRKRIGPFAREQAGGDQQRKNFAALLRAGHAPDISYRIAFAEPGDSHEND